MFVSSIDRFFFLLKHHLSRRRIMNSFRFQPIQNLEIEYEKGQKMRINWVKCKMKMDK